MIGIAVCTVLFAGCFFIGEGGAVLYFNLASFAVVGAGTVGAGFLSFPYERLRIALKVARNAYRKDQVKSPDEIVKVLLDISVRSRYDGILSLEKVGDETTILFLRGALGLLVDGFKEDEIRETLHNEMYYFKLRRQQSERVFRTLAVLAPGFGVAGSIIGLIGMIVGMGDTGVILKTIPIALTSTLYGTVLSYYILVPMAENIHNKTQRELFMQGIITDGIIEIGKEKNPFKLERRLSSFLTPSAREGKLATMSEIKQRYIKMREKEKQPRPQVIETLAMRHKQAL